MIKSKKQSLIVIGVFALVMLLGTVTYAFFNYTRTGSSNIIKTGRIYFNTTQDGNLQLTNIFPIKSTEVNANNLDSVAVGIVGDTTYSDGEEFEITIVDVNNTVNGKNIPINYIATYEAVSGKSIGEESDDYWNARNSKDSDIYTLDETGKVEDGKQVLVGYIKNSANGIEGTLTIKAYIDGDRIAITDTPDENSEWQQGRTVFTTTEWNSFQNSGTPISFKIKAESNEGIWVEEKLSINTMNLFPTDIYTSAISPNIKEIYFNRMDENLMDTRYSAATIKADLTYNNEGRVLSWLEKNETDNTKYTMYVVSDGETYLTTANMDLFYNSYINKLEKIEFNNVNTSRITDMSSLFFSQENLKELDLTGLDTSNVVNMRNFTYNSYNLKKIDLSGLNLSKVQVMTYMFYANKSLSDINLDNVKTHDVIDMVNMFSGCESLKYIDLSGLDTPNVQTVNGMFYDCTNLTSINLSGLGGDSLSNIGSIFGNCPNLKTIDMSNFNFGTIQNLSGSSYSPFYGNTIVENINLSSAKISNVTNMQQLFYGCTSLKIINLGNIDISNVTNMSKMFYGCSSLVNLDLQTINLENIINVQGMFENCTNLKTIDLSGVTTIKSAYNMFYNVPALTTIYVSNKFDFSNQPANMPIFTGSTNLVGGNGTPFDSTKVDKTMAVIDTIDHPGYLTLKTS